MTEQSSDSNLKEQDYRKWVEGQSTEALEKELRTLELRRMLLQKKDPEEEARLEQHEEQEEWDALSPEQQAEANRNTFESWDTPEERAQAAAIMELMADPEKLAQFEAERKAQLAAMKPEERAALQGEITPWITEQLEVARRLEAVQRELAARRIHELSKGEAASALATASQHANIDPEVAKRRAIVKQNSTSGTKAICVLLDGNKVPLPPGPDWEAFSTHKEPWEDAYNKKPRDEKRRRRIRVIIAKDKKA